MRLWGLIKAGVIIMIDVIIIYYLLGMKYALVIGIGLIILGWLGEYVALGRDGAISQRYMTGYEQQRLAHLRTTIIERVQTQTHLNISYIQLHILPSDTINACAYGVSHIGITRGALQACDDMTLTAVLAHEVSHTIHMDAVFHRLIFANVTMMIIGLIVASFVSVSLIWILFLGLCIVGVCGGFFSIFVARGLSRGVSGLFTIMQHVIVFIYQATMGVISRSCEYRADRYAAELGYGPQLIYFLSRFVNDDGQQSLPELIYNSHPATYRRLYRLNQITRTQSSNTLTSRR